MSEEMRDQHYAEQLVHKYEEMVARNESYYFDVDQFEEIIDFYCESNKYAFAIKAIEYAYTLFPENTTLALREVQILAEMGFLTKALSKLKILRKFEPQNEEVLLTMASIYSQLREHKMAIELYKKALEFAGDELFEEINMEIALEYENMDRFDKAIEVLHLALERQPENETLLYELAYCYEMSDRTAECIEYYKRFLDTFPYSFPAWYNMGNAYQKLDQLTDAVDAYDYCLAIQDDFVPAIMNKAHALFKMEKYHEAIKVFEESYTYETPQANTYCHIGECFEKLGELDKALFYYKKSMHCDEMFGDAYIGMGIVLDLMGRTKEGSLFMEKAITMEPENVDYRLFMAELLNKMGEFEKSGEIYRFVAERFEDNEDVWLDYADWAMQQKNSGLALQLTNDGWSHNPQSDSLGFRKVAYLMESGSIAEAEELLLRLMTKNPEGGRDLAEYYPAIEQNQLFIDLSRSINP